MVGRLYMIVFGKGKHSKLGPYLVLFCLRVVLLVVKICCKHLYCTSEFHKCIVFFPQGIMRGVMIIRLYILGLLSLNAVECFDFWNASSTNVALPSTYAGCHVFTTMCLSPQAYKCISCSLIMQANRHTYSF